MRTTDPTSRRRELAAFLRTRRERVLPEDVGLPAGGRRRTPGLRREEVAQLAGVGVTWYTWLEQGRDINASAQVLEAVARTLRLDRTERAHLLQLAGATDVGSQLECSPLPDHLPALMERLEPFPVAVLSARYDLLAWNTAYRFLVSDLAEVPEGERNLLWLYFTHPAWGRSCSGYEDAARHLIAQYRGAMSIHLDDPLWTGLVDDLRAESTLFAELWESHDVTAPQVPLKRFTNDRVGEVVLLPQALWLDRAARVRMMTYTPADPRTRMRLERLVAESLPAGEAPEPVVNG